MERVFRRAGLALSFSQGFHPKPRMTFPLALAVGIEGIDEVMEIELAENHSPDELLRRLSPCAPAGLVFHAVEFLPDGSKKAQVQNVCYEAVIPPSYQSMLRERIERLMAADSWPVERTRGRAPIDVRPLILHLGMKEHMLEMRLRVESRASVGAREVLAALDAVDLEHQGVCLRRTAVEVCG
jgi:radical SAM-linked protein